MVGDGGVGDDGSTEMDGWWDVGHGGVIWVGVIGGGVVDGSDKRVSCWLEDRNVR